MHHTHHHHQHCIDSSAPDKRRQRRISCSSASLSREIHEHDGTVDNAHKPSITPNAIPTPCPTLMAVGELVSDGKLKDVGMELVLRGMETKEMGEVGMVLLELVLLGETAMSEA
jgi:hypothetical protein